MVVTTAIYTFDKVGPVAPALAPGTGTYNVAQNVVITPAVDAVNTYYTLDGTDPDNGSNLYVGPISVDAPDDLIITLKVVSYDTLENRGTVATETYTFDKTGSL